MVMARTMMRSPALVARFKPRGHFLSAGSLSPTESSIWMRGSTPSTRSLSSLAHVIGDTSTPLLSQTIGDRLVQAKDEYGEREALVVADQGVRWTYSELHSRARSVGHGLLAAGLAPGDRLGVWMPNCSEWTLLQMATALVGVVLVSINPAYRPGELHHALTLAGVKAIVMAPTFGPSDYRDMMRQLAPELDSTARGAALQAKRLPMLQRVILARNCGREDDGTFGGVELPRGFMGFEELYAGDHECVSEAAAGLKANDIINLQFTSGTTGLPKGASLSHHNILNNGYFIGRTMGLSEQDRVCIPVPLFHCFGLVLGNLACLTHGSAMVHPQARFCPEATLRVAAEEKCTALYGVPTMFINELALPSFASHDLSSLRTGIMAGSVCPVEVMQQVMSKMNMEEVTICYGMTETSPVSFQTCADDAPHIRAETVGRVHPHVECKVIDKEGKTLPRAPLDAVNDEAYTGELCTKGYLVMRGYWNDPAMTAETIDDQGWLHTGDLATIDEDGYCRIVGRLKDVIIRGGENIFPREVEDALFQCPEIQNVSVVGVPDGVYGEATCAWVVPSPKGLEVIAAAEAGGEGERALAELIRGFAKATVAWYKVPRHVLVCSQEEIPMTVSGKIKKFELVEMAMAKLGIDK